MDYERFVSPLLMTILVFLVYNFDTVIYKVKLTIQGIAYFLFCNDKSWKKPDDPFVIFEPIQKESNADNGKISRKTIIFVRHGESTWNDTFNKGHHRSSLVFVLGFIPGLIKALSYEFYLLLSGQIDSWFYDSPLSELGLNQVQELGKFLRHYPHDLTDDEEKLVKIMRGDLDAPESKIVSSSLRRAISTVAAAFSERFERRPKDSILILPSLQEVSRNPDTLSITKPFTAVSASWIEKKSDVCDFPSIFANHVSMELHTGNKPMDTNGLKRMEAFCDDVFSSKIKEDNIIVGGHSIWFRSFFRTFIPYNDEHVAKTNKVVNAGCVAFTLLKAESKNGPKYMIETDSIQVVYGGF
eukprot:CAMPEP_0184863732 /NCGR_PEP_ID=MMETSP0580-20130426/12209_1 /TAXON_ID=1118495 /ORGANISM="Dactyliosolen fragilissimus" /LENGTH=354 /DNA_ID=CAMNT_0027362219 /DNA_START=41 /DNA_END=1105 /DNA_ORIENTATION=+